MADHLFAVGEVIVHGVLFDSKNVEARRNIDRQSQRFGPAGP